MVMPSPNGTVDIFTRGSVATALLNLKAQILPCFNTSGTESSGLATDPYQSVLSYTMIPFTLTSFITFS